MPEQKQTTEVTVQSLDKGPDESVRDDSQEIIKIMKKITGDPRKMWGPSIVGFGKYQYKPPGFFSAKPKYISLYEMPEKKDQLEKPGNISPRKDVCI